jgi:membrane protein
MALRRLRKPFERVADLVQRAVVAWIDDRATSRGAALAYYTVFSIAPLLLIAMSIAGLVFGREAAQGAVVRQLSGMMGRDAAQSIQSILQAARDTKNGLLGTLVSIPLLAIGATTVFAELQDALNQIWRTPAKRVSGLWAWFRVRFLSLSLVAALGFLLLVSLLVSTLLSAVGRLITGDAETTVLIEAGSFALSLGVTILFFAAIYKILPDARIPWRDVWVGAAASALLFHVGKYGIAAYVSTSDVASCYGAAGALIIVLVWVFYSAQIFLLGAEFTKVMFADRRGEPVTPPVRPAG